jgi:hypothetical protein
MPRCLALGAGSGTIGHQAPAVRPTHPLLACKSIERVKLKLIEATLITLAIMLFTK